MNREARVFVVELCALAAMRPNPRRLVEDVIEGLIDALDTLDGDSDLEASDGDEERDHRDNPVHPADLPFLPQGGWDRTGWGLREEENPF